MKNETARREIEALDYYLQNHTSDYSEESHMAMMMASEALEITSCIKEKCAYCPHCENCDVDDETLEIKALEQEPNRCDSCIHSEEQDGASCYECVKGMADNFEAQPCEDCISREEAIRIAEQGQIQGYEWQFKKLCNLPSVTPKVEWIPVSEKMPDINIHVLAQFVMGGMAECYYAHNWWHIVGGFRISGDEVIAWMPLPQPYKAEGEGEE